VDERCEVFDHVGFFVSGDTGRPRQGISMNRRENALGNETDEKSTLMLRNTASERGWEMMLR